MRCSSCGEDVLASGRYCPSCGARLDGSQAPTLTVAPGDRPPPSDAIDGARFISGTLLASRYRIVGLLGCGGMGEVYRAEDLKLAQPVALKFLPSDVSLRPDRLDRFLQEVRLARQVSHPNVCRVHDIGETGGQHFLSMEYIDGEDLASLLRRIGRLPSDKALELARQLCAGLAAAHARNVLHRDLKPANVIIDGRGVAHLVDFGLADLANQRREVHEIAGTLGYMAPEQLEGRAPTMRTDIYALGLVLYEMFTGQRALPSTAAALGGRGPTATPANPSWHLPDLDPAIERVILRCLEPDPARRPASALAVAAALPGGNPLAAMIAAGETPSPDMVAAAGEDGALSPAIGALCFGGVVAGLLLLSVVMRNVNLIGLTNIERGPQFFVERAHTALRNLGYPDPSSDEAFGFISDTDYLRHIDENDPSPTRWRALATPQPPALLFWYRQSPRLLVPIGGTNFVTRQNPPDSRSGMASLSLDQTGRLVSLLAVPVQLETRQQESSAATAATAIDWAPLFAEAGLSMAQFSPADPQWIPPVFADTRKAWQGVYPERPDVPIRIEAAAALGRPVYLEIVAPWTRPRNEDTGPANTSGDRVVLRMRTVVTPLMIVITGLLALYNVRQGRGDRRGALRLSLFILGAGLLSDGLASGDLTFLTRGQPLTVFLAVMVWVLYLALEPHLRRTWPDTMIGWSRLLSGGVRDPLVGRDLLVGVLVAIGNAVILTLHTWLRQWSGRPPQFPVGAGNNPFDGVAATSDLLLGGRMAISRVVGSVLSIPVWMGTMLIFLLLFVLLMLLRRRMLAMAALVVGLTSVYVLSHGGWMLANAPADHFPPAILDVLIFAAVHAGVVFVAVRFGLLTMLVASFVSQLLLLIPIVINSPAPYAASSRLIVALVLALAAYGWYTSLAGRPMFGVLFAPTAPSRHS